MWEKKQLFPSYGESKDLSLWGGGNKLPTFPLTWMSWKRDIQMAKAAPDCDIAQSCLLQGEMRVAEAEGKGKARDAVHGWWHMSLLQAFPCNKFRT